MPKPTKKCEIEPLDFDYFQTLTAILNNMSNKINEIVAYLNEVGK